METFQKYFSLALLAILLVFVGYTWYEKTKMEQRIIDLQNELAKRMPTIEVAPGVFEKLAQVEKNLQNSIDQSTQQGKDLAKRIEDTKAKVLTLQTGVVNANSKIDELLKNKENPDGSWYADVNKKDGPLYLRGKITAGPTKDNPIHPELNFGIEDLKLSIAVTQDKTGQWAVESALPPPLRIEWKVSKVNPYLLEPSWLEKVGFTAQLGLTRRQYTLGAGYKIKSWYIGPYALFDDNNTYGASVTWFPWEK